VYDLFLLDPSISSEQTILRKSNYYEGLEDRTIAFIPFPTFLYLAMELNEAALGDIASEGQTRIPDVI
jgi:hypothetical protein